MHVTECELFLCVFEAVRLNVHTFVLLFTDSMGMSGHACTVCCMLTCSHISFHQSRSFLNNCFGLKP